MDQLVEVDKVEFTVLINDEIDQISPSPNDQVKHARSFAGVPLDDIPEPSMRAGARLEMPMHNICCGAHGISLFITVTTKGKRRSILFDTGPEGDILENNVRRLRLNLGDAELITLSHWHRDHTGGVLSAIKLINEGRKDDSRCVVDVHPDRPCFRGVMLNEPISLVADPSWEEIEAAGGIIEAHAEPRTVLDDLFLISGEIPRLTDYEKGIPGGIRLDKPSGSWESDELITDERYLVCKLKGKGIVVFTGCSHAGLINISRDATKLTNSPIHAIVGGYHLADAPREKMQSTLADLRSLSPKLLLPGHCTGWRFRGLIENVMPGQLAPLFGGTHYELD